MNWILETPRLRLREFVVEDADAMYALNADPDQIKYTGDEAFKSVAESQKFLSNYSDYALNGFGRWACILKQDNTFIGWCGLKHHENSSPDLGYRFYKSYWNKGLATEAAQACIEYGFEKLNLDEIVGRSHPENTYSIRILEKLGMTYWKEENIEGIKNAQIYKLTISEWIIQKSTYL